MHNIENYTEGERVRLRGKHGAGATHMMEHHIAYEGKKLEEIKDSVHEGDKVYYLRRDKNVDKYGWLLDAVVVRKFPQLIQVEYLWEGKKETAYMSYKDMYLLSVGNVDATLQKKDGTVVVTGRADRVSPEKLINALKRPIG